MDLRYRNQAALLIRILPEIAREKYFALHGGTAINLFYHNMPRLSVDIDLTTVPFGNRKTDLALIRSKLLSIGERLRENIPDIRVKAPVEIDDELKLYCSIPEAIVKVEVNTINRGINGVPVLRPLCHKAQEIFDSFCEIQVVPDAQLFGGKIVAALDRQHPRDLFDIKKLGGIRKKRKVSSILSELLDKT
ncbi:MAG TPA: nucleotidyl transferase AbiEii/AbiGii toxin family protein [Ignavibacteria bacterium]|nr:nucleotidyl transferase AbiEii/AbiGii toxin family protein [Ignavibacteria bacterium]